MVRSDSSFTPAGATVRERGWLRAWLPFGGLAVGMGFWLGAAWAPEALRGEKGVWLVFVLAGYGLWAWKRAKKVLQRHVRGAEGEERVAQALQGLSDRWTAYHSVPFEGGDLDHVLVGPPGLVVLETIRWTGRVHIREGQVWDGERVYPGYEVASLLARTAAFSESLSGEKTAVYTVVVVAGGRIAGELDPAMDLLLVDEAHVVNVLESLPSVSEFPGFLLDALENLNERAL